MKKSLPVPILLVLLVSAAAAQFTYTPVTCASMNVPWISGINNNGVMVGAYYTDTDPTWHALIIRGGKCSPLGVGTFLSTKFSIAGSLNDRGDVAGYYYEGEAYITPFHGFVLKKNGELISLEFPTADSNNTMSINKSGKVVGFWLLGNIVHGYTWENGSFSEFMVPSSTETLVDGINASGEYSGMWDNDPNKVFTHGFIYSRGQVTTFDVPLDNSVGAQPGGINAKGHVTGGHWNADFSVVNGFLKIGPQYLRLQYPGAAWTVPCGINNDDRIVGFYYDSQFSQHAFIADLKK